MLISENNVCGGRCTKDKFEAANIFRAQNGITGQENMGTPFSGDLRDIHKAIVSLYI
jgi:hypothetical protein